MFRRANLVVVLAVLVVLIVVGGTAHADTIAGPIVNPSNNHSYYLLTNNKWTNSQAESVTLGGNLVTINDADENAWVLSTFSNYGGIPRSLWVGFNDVDTEGEWAWTSGEPVTYTNFSPGNPDNMNNEDFAYMIPPSGMWNDGQNGLWGTYNLYGVIEVETNQAW